MGRERQKRGCICFCGRGGESEKRRKRERERERVNTFSREFMDSFSLLPLFPVFLWEEKRKF